MSMPPFVRDPSGLIHKLQRFPHKDRGWETYCEEPVLFSKKWRSLFSAEGQATCLSCLATNL